MNSKEAPTRGQETELEKRVRERFGVLPNFFRLASDTPEITENLWGFARFAYLDNPLPSVFKERLFVHLSRFCDVRYCIARHVGFLVGLGRPSGDAQASPQTIDEVVQLLRRSFPRGEQIRPLLAIYENRPSFDVLPSSGSEEEALFAFAGHVFLQTPDAPRCLDVLKHLLAGVQSNYLILFLAFVRTAHYWTKVHPEIAFEEDLNQLLATHEALAECVLNDPESCSAEVSQRLLDELPSLRQQIDRATGLMTAIVDSSDDAIVSKTLEGVVTSWNRAAERLFGYTAQEAIGQPITNLIIPSDRLKEEEMILDQIGRGNRIEHFETVRVRKDGSVVDISLTISPVKDATGRIVGASKIARDITARKQTDQALRQSRAQFQDLAERLDLEVRDRTKELEERNVELKELSWRLQRIQDDERRHIARELHDSAGQTLAALSMNLAKCVLYAKQKNSQLPGVMEETELLLHQLTKEIRTTSYLLHPPLLDEIGVSGALDWYVRGVAERSGLDIKLDIAENVGRLPTDMELVVFRLVQESLTNIHRHSGSRSAIIRIARNEEKVSVEIRDSGKGMPATKLAEIQSEGGGVGIRGMRARVHQFHGEINIESNGSGTKIAVTLPVANDWATATA